MLCAGLDIPCGLHLSTALLMTFVAAQDPAEGWLEYAMSSLPSSVERITRLEITWTVGQALSWAFFSRWFGMDPADNLNLIQPGEPLDRKFVVDVHWSPENNSNSWSYTVMAGQTLHGALVYSAADDSYTLSQTVVETGETSSQVVQCQSGKEVRRAVKGVLLLHVLWRWQGQLPKHYCRVRRHGLHASPAYITPGTIPPFFSAAPAAVVATPSAVVVPAPALSYYFLCFPTVSAATALV